LVSLTLDFCGLYLFLEILSLNVTCLIGLEEFDAKFKSLSLLFNDVELSLFSLLFVVRDGSDCDLLG